MKSIPILVILLILSVGGNVYLAIHHSPAPETVFAQKYADLKRQYINLAESQCNMLELVFTKLNMKLEFSKIFDGAYADMTDEQFQERVRRKIVRLEMTIQDLKKE